MGAEKVRIEASELADPRVDAVLAQQGSFGMRPVPARVDDRKASLLYRPWLVLMVAGTLGGLAGWAVIEPFFDDGLRVEGRVDRLSVPPDAFGYAELKVSGVEVIVTGETRVHRAGDPLDVEALDGARRVTVVGQEVARGDGTVLVAYDVGVLEGEAPPGDVSLPALRLRDALVAFAVFPLVAALVSLFVAAADGLLSRAWRRAALCGVVGLSAGLALGLVSSVASQLVYGLGTALVQRIDAGGAGTSTAGFLTQMVARGLAWAVAGVAMGLGQGIALRSRRLVVNGMLGGVIGALVGGMLFDPVDRLVNGGAGYTGAEASRAIGFAVIGLGAGLMIGVVELLARDAWLKMLAGPLAGKEFMLFRNPTAIGSSPKADVYLFKDAAVEPTHALIHVLGEGYELESVSAGAPAEVNGRPVRRARLEPGDQIRIGKTVLAFAVKEGR